LEDGGAWANPADAPQGTVLYRFTTRDCGAVVVRDSVHGWGFLGRECVQRPASLYNDDDDDSPLQPDGGECPPLVPSCSCPDDRNPCTVDHCVSNVCRHDPVDGACPDDG